MKTPAVFLLFLGLAFARGETIPNKINQLDVKNVHQVSKPSGLETASTRTSDVQLTHMQNQVNRMDNAYHQDQKFSQHAQLQNSQSHIQHQATTPFHSQNQVSQIHSQDMNQQFHSQDMNQQFHNQDQAEQFYSQGQVQQFRNQGLTATGSPVHSDQDIANLLQSQQHMTPTGVSMIQSQSKEQVRDFSAQQIYSGSAHPEREFYQDRRSSMDLQDQLSEKRFGDSTSQQSQILSGVHSTEIRAGGFPQAYLQRSAFDNREQPLVLPGGISQSHSTSVVVSGLKNLPVLPGLVYSAGTVPSAHAVAYSRPWFQGGAYVKQHWQTPYARYVYSHIL